jgi:hypothetical protein
MRIDAAAQPWQTALTRSAVLRAVGLSVFGLSAWLPFSSAGGPAWRAGSLVAVLALAALASVAWYLSRAGAERRRQAVLDRYAEQKQAKGTQPRREPRC